VGGGTFGNLDKGTKVIMEEWKNYKRMFYRVEGNVWQARIFENDGLLEGRSNLGSHVFGNLRYSAMGIRGKTIRVGNLVVGGRTKDKVEMEREMGEMMNMAEYFRLRNTLMEIIRIYGNQEGVGKCLDEFIRAKKRGGGALRREITGKRSPQQVNSDPRALPGSKTLWGEGVRLADRGLIEFNYGLWGKACLPNCFRGFLFNLMQGKLYLNNVLQRIRANENRRNCTFCIIRGRQELSARGIGIDRPEYEYFLGILPVETSHHIFWDCEHVQDLIQKTYRWVKGAGMAENGFQALMKEKFFMGEKFVENKHTICDLVWKHYIKFFIYQCRTLNRIPSFGSLKFELEGIVGITKSLGWESYLLKIRE